MHGFSRTMTMLGPRVGRRMAYGIVASGIGSTAAIMSPEKDDDDESHDEWIQGFMERQRIAMKEEQPAAAHTAALEEKKNQALEKLLQKDIDILQRSVPPPPKAPEEGGGGGGRAAAEEDEDEEDHTMLFIAMVGVPMAMMGGYAVVSFALNPLRTIKYVLQGAAGMLLLVIPNILVVKMMGGGYGAVGGSWDPYLLSNYGQNAEDKRNKLYEEAKDLVTGANEKKEDDGEPAQQTPS